MESVFGNLNGLEIMFLGCAVVGGMFLLFRIVLMAVGAGGDTDVDADGGGDIGADFEADADAHHADTDAGFKMLSLQGMTSFFLMFGLVGFALYRQSGVGSILSILGGTAAGTASLWVIGKIFRSIGRLQSDGTVNTVSAIGATGTVYLTIPGNGTGRVMVHVRDRLREFDAAAHDHEEIRTGEPVKVVWVNGNILIVERITSVK